MFQRTNPVLYLFVLIIVVVLTAEAVSAQDTIEITTTAATTNNIPTAIVMQSLEIERSPLEWVIVLQGAIFMFLLTLLMINQQVRSYVLDRVRVRHHQQYDI